MGNKERQQNYRQRINSDPKKREQYLKNRRDAYQRRKAAGNIQSVKDLGRRDQKALRKQWRERQKVSRDKRKMELKKLKDNDRPIEPALIVNEASSSTGTLESPIRSQNNTLVSPSNSRQKKAGRKALRKDRSASYRRIKKLEEIVCKKNRTIEKLKKRLQRSSPLTTSPMTKLNKKYKGLKKMPQNVQRALLFEDTFCEASKKHIKLLRSNRQRKLLYKTFKTSAMILKRYKLHCAIMKKLGVPKQIASKYSEPKRISPENTVHRYFLRDDVSRIANGKKLTLTRNKKKHQKRFLLDTMVMLHKRFSTEYPLLKMSYTTFTRYKPFYVITPSIRDRDTCLCKQCENLQLFLKKALNLKMLETPIKSIASIPAAICCSENDVQCSYNLCTKCKNKKILPEVTDNDKIVEVQQWCQKNETRQKINVKDGSVTEFTVKRTVKDTSTMPAAEFCTKMNLMSSKYKKHSFIIQHQYNSFKYLKENAPSNAAIMIIDFSENYILKYSSQVQSAHFGASQLQASLHTGVLYTKNSKPESFCSISGNLQHGPQAIWEHIKPILSNLHQNHPNVTDIHFFSDGPCSQYRQKGNFLLFSTNIYKAGFQLATWNFWEAGHGRGPADGVGAAVKRKADLLVQHGADLISAESLYSNLKSSDLNVNLFYIPDNDILSACQVVCESLLPVPKTMSIHQIATTTEKEIWYRDISCFCGYVDSSPSNICCKCYNLKKHVFGGTKAVSGGTKAVSGGTKAIVLTEKTVLGLHEENILPNKWVVVKYENAFYPGKVTAVNSPSDITVSCMAYVRQNENKFFWPKVPDILSYKQSDILTVMEEPNKLDSGHIEVPFLLWNDLQNI